MNKTPVIALLGQPNSGKSTIFNMMTGSHQHVGNWPGKTVEQKEGEFRYNGKQMILTDLPGSYSLSAGSDEEIITKDYITSGNADLVLVMADASQLRRSLYMLADFVVTKVPAVLVLNMMDVAQGQGITIDVNKLSEKLGIPVVPMSAIRKKDYQTLYSVIERSLNQK
ncbi:MAG: FeoB small GTPase domain-containing protein, partial [Eubacteriales bacterium]|nr:FeoB small GTPase domain-containing protein [Eubacteriales bacterium]